MKNKEFYVQKVVEDILSVKFFVFITSCFFLLVDKISSDNWVMIALGIAGFHTANTMTSIVKGVPPVIPRRTYNVDNPDL